MTDLEANVERLTYNAGVEAAAKVMDDLDRGGFFAAAIRARAKRDAPNALVDH